MKAFAACLFLKFGLVVSVHSSDIDPYDNRAHNMGSPLLQVPIHQRPRIDPLEVNTTPIRPPAEQGTTPSVHDPLAPAAPPNIEELRRRLVKDSDHKMHLLIACICGPCIDVVNSIKIHPCNLICCPAEFAANFLLLPMCVTYRVCTGMPHSKKILLRETLHCKPYSCCSGRTISLALGPECCGSCSLCCCDSEQQKQSHMEYERTQQALDKEDDENYKKYSHMI